MEILYPILAFIFGAVLAYFIVKSSSISRKIYDELQQNFSQKEAEFNKILAEISAENKSQNQKIAEQQELNFKQNTEIKELQNDKNQLIGLKSQLSAQNENLQKLLDSQKEEIAKMQEVAKTEFQNLANKILEEKTLKFTEQNQQNLKNILNPLQEKITDFEKKVENTHKESIDYHAALRQQIIGLKDLNVQMSKETVNLTKALKGDSKIQGNWGELV